jgi:hypothetical protein
MATAPRDLHPDPDAVEELMRREFEKLADEWDNGLTLEQARALLDSKRAATE